MIKYKKYALLAFVLITSSVIFIYLYFYPQYYRKNILIKPLMRFHYQLQGYDHFNYKSKTPTLVVIDYSKNGKDESAFSKEEITNIKKNQNVVLSYLSIGESESYRWYFKEMPQKLISNQNIKFKDNFKVPYWEQEWKEIIYSSENSYLSRIMKSAFDGVYLDLVDAYAFFANNTNAANEMALFIISLSKKARSLNLKFIIVQQNAPCLYREITNQEILKEYWKSIDAISLESTFMFGEKDEDNSFSPQESVLSCIESYHDKDIKIFGVEYVRDKLLQAKAIEMFRQHRIIGLATDKYLKGEFFVHSM